MKRGKSDSAAMSSSQDTSGVDDDSSGSSEDEEAGVLEDDVNVDYQMVGTEKIILCVSFG